MKRWLTLIAVALSAGAVAQTWTSAGSSNPPPTTFPEDLYYSFTADSKRQYEWDSLMPNWFKVTGATSQLPPWTMRYQNLAYNTWNYYEAFSTFLEIGDVVNNYRDYYTLIGYQSWTNGTSTHRRDLDEKVTNDMWFEVIVGNGNPGGGP